MRPPCSAPASAGCATEVFARAEYPDRDARDEALAGWLLERGTRVVVLAGYMELLGGTFLERFPRAVINVHPSLLPAFPGLSAVEQALSYGVKVFGVTVHFVDAGVDTGPVILQRAVELPGAATPEEVLAGPSPARAFAAAGSRQALGRRGSPHRRAKSSPRRGRSRVPCG